MRKIIVIAVVTLVALVAVFALASPHVYLLQRVNSDEVGVRMRGGRIVDVVPPGIYSDIGLYASMQRYSTQAYQMSVTDPEVITLDNQRLGVTVSASVFRPDIANAELIKTLWTKYRTVYINNDALQGAISDLSTQAMKVCIGNRPFRDSVIGSDRDSLRNCIDDELNKLAENFGLSVANVTVPNVSLSPEVQALLDAITKSRLETEKAEQDRLKAIAEGTARQAEQEAIIRVEQARMQEETKQQTILAKLNQEKLVAQRAVIEAQKANDLLSAQRDLEINRAMALAAKEKSLAELAREITLAELYSEHPSYVAIQMAHTNASAIQATDKLIFVQEGSFPQLVFGQGLDPVVPIQSGDQVP